MQMQFVSSKTNAAAAKSLQSCPTLCDPIDSSPPGFSIPGMFQARVLEWVAITFSTKTNETVSNLTTKTGQIFTRKANRYNRSNINIQFKFQKEIRALHGNKLGYKVTDHIV